MQLSHGLPLPMSAADVSRKMSIAALSEADGSSPILSSAPLSKSFSQDSLLRVQTLPQTPPDSTAGSPALKSYGKFFSLVRSTSQLLTVYKNLRPRLPQAARLILPFRRFSKAFRRLRGLDLTAFQASRNLTRRFESSFPPTGLLVRLHGLH